MHAVAEALAAVDGHKLYLSTFPNLVRIFKEQLVEAKALETDTTRPGHYWQDITWWYEGLASQGAASAYYNFLQFEGERFSSGRPLGDYSQFANSSPEALEKLPFVRDYRRYTNGIPAEFHIDQPKMPQQFGIKVGDMRLTYTYATRYQRYITNLYNLGVLTELRKQDTPIVLEIGGGFGPVAEAVLRCLPGAKCVLIDIPAVLWMAANFLLIARPDLKQYIYDPADADAFSVAQGLAEADIVLLPHYKQDALAELPRIDLALNLYSFQEMSQENVESYADLIRSKLTGFFYSDNMPRHPHNYDLRNSIGMILRRRFHVFPDAEMDLKIERLRNYMWQAHAHLATAENYDIPTQGRLWGTHYSIGLSAMDLDLEELP
jgi:hypothetical protein